MKKSSYAERLIKTVLKYSVSSIWEEAVQEWYILDCIEDSDLSRSCICGKERLFYLFTIKNKYNGSVLFPIGSTCIKKFERNDLNNEVSVRESMFKLYHAVKDKKFITLSTKFFSRKIITRLYTDGAFNTAYNNYNGKDDYEFIMKMFNKKNKYTITRLQQRKINAIIIASIIPYLNNNLKHK